MESIARAKPKLNAMAVLAFVAGATGFWKLNLIGELYVVELILLFVGLIAALKGGIGRPLKSGMFGVFVIACLLLLAGYIVSDLSRGSEPEQFLRGWGRAIFVFTSFAALTMLFSLDRRNVWWFLLGYGLGAVVYLKLTGGLPMRSPYGWKASYAYPLGILLLSIAPFVPQRILAAAILGLGVYSVSMDFRIHGALCIVVGVLTWVGAAKGRAKLDFKRIAVIGVAGLVAIVLGMTVVNLYSDDYNDARRLNSDVGRESALRFGLAAIASSPVIGYGSWSTSPEILRLAVQGYEETMNRRGSPADNPETFATTNAHSQILQAWVEGGILAAGLFFILAYQLVRYLVRVTASSGSDYLRPLFLYVMLFQLWNTFMSPLSSGARIQIAAVMAMMVLLAVESVASKRKSLSAPTRHRRRRGVI